MAEQKKGPTLKTEYRNSTYSQITNPSGFYSGKIPEAKRIKIVVEKIKFTFGLTDAQVRLEVANGERIYKITLLNQDAKKTMFGFFIYIPLEKRLDIWESKAEKQANIILQYQNKKPVFKNYTTFFDKIHFDKLFDNIVNAVF